MLPENRISRRDEALLSQMLEAAEAASYFSQGRTRADLENHLMFYYAVAKAVELIGEAANNVSAASRAKIRGIDWERIVGMRHRLVHDFHGVNKDILWDVIQDDMPILITQLQAALEQRNG